MNEIINIEFDYQIVDHENAIELRWSDVQGEDEEDILKVNLKKIL